MTISGHVCTAFYTNLTVTVDGHVVCVESTYRLACSVSMRSEDMIKNLNMHISYSTITDTLYFFFFFFLHILKINRKTKIKQRSTTTYNRIE